MSLACEDKQVLVEVLKTPPIQQQHFFFETWVTEE